MRSTRFCSTIRRRAGRDLCSAPRQAGGGSRGRRRAGGRRRAVRQRRAAAPSPGRTACGFQGAAARFVVVDEIPKGATGKLQRIGLHEKLADKLELGLMKDLRLRRRRDRGAPCRAARRPAVIDVSLVARGPHLEGDQGKNGLTLRYRRRGAKVAKVPASERSGRARPAGLCHRDAEGTPARPGRGSGRCRRSWVKDTAVVTAMNGIPFWYFYGLDGPLAKTGSLETVDPGGEVWERAGTRSA